MNLLMTEFDCPEVILCSGQDVKITNSLTPVRWTWNNVQDVLLYLDELDADQMCLK